MRKRVNEKHLKAVKDYVRSSDAYTFEKFLAKAGVLDSFERSGNELKGCCLLHPERNPSASFNDSRGIWGCFSCGCGGDYIELVRLAGGGGEKSYFFAAEKLLKSDKKMQLALGISSVFESDVQMRELREVKRPAAPRWEEKRALSYLDLTEQMRGCTVEEAKTAILFMQKGLAVEDLVGVLRGEDAAVLDLEGI